MKITGHAHREWTECKHRDGQCCDACHVDYAAIRHVNRMTRNAKECERRAARKAVPA